MAAAGALAAEKLDVAGISYKKYIFNEKELIPDEKTLGSLMMAFSRDCDVIVAVGSGTLNDLCKFSSFQAWADYMVFCYLLLLWTVLYQLELLSSQIM